MNRIETSKIIAILGNRIIIDIWKCYDKYVTRYGRPSEVDNYTISVKVSTIKDKVIVRFGDNNSMVSVIVSNISKEANIKIVNLDDTEIILEKTEAEQLFST